MLPKIHICVHSVCCSSSTPCMAEFQAKSNSSSNSQNKDNTDYAANRQCRYTTGNGHQDIQQQTTDED